MFVFKYRTYSKCNWSHSIAGGLIVLWCIWLFWALSSTSGFYILKIWQAFHSYFNILRWHEKGISCTSLNSSLASSYFLCITESCIKSASSVRIFEPVSNWNVPVLRSECGYLQTRKNNAGLETVIEKIKKSENYLEQVDFHRERVEIILLHCFLDFKV